jgi:hypothetical protein
VAPCYSDAHDLNKPLVIACWDCRKCRIRAATTLKYQGRAPQTITGGWADGRMGRRARRAATTARRPRAETATGGDGHDGETATGGDTARAGTPSNSERSLRSRAAGGGLSFAPAPRVAPCYSDTHALDKPLVIAC